MPATLPEVSQIEKFVPRPQTCDAPEAARYLGNYSRTTFNKLVARTSASPLGGVDGSRDPASGRARFFYSELDRYLAWLREQKLVPGGKMKPGLVAITAARRKLRKVHK